MKAAIRTGKLKVNKGICDYVAEGIFYRGDIEIPCEIGYNEYGKRLQAEYIFIKRDGVNKDGYAYNKETLYCLDYNDIEVNDEEVIE